MKKVIKRVAIVLLVALVVIQLIHPAKNVSAAVPPTDISNMYPVPDSVKTILAKACNDCHSNNTRYPWYSKIQPVDWWLNDHVTEGKDELNLSEFGSFTLLKQSKKLKKMAREVDEGDMPLDSYLWIHKDAVLSPAEKAVFMGWAQGLSQQLYAKVPADEIEKDKKRMEEKKRQREQK